MTRKGIGYGGSVKNKWSTSEYYQSLLQTNKKIENILGIFTIILKNINSLQIPIPEECVESMLHSGILVYLESCLKNNSFQEMRKQFSLYKNILKFLK